MWRISRGVITNIFYQKSSERKWQSHQKWIERQRRLIRFVIHPNSAQDWWDEQDDSLPHSSSFDLQAIIKNSTEGGNELAKWENSAIGTYEQSLQSSYRDWSINVGALNCYFYWLYGFNTPLFIYCNWISISLQFHIWRKVPTFVPLSDWVSK